MRLRLALSTATLLALPGGTLLATVDEAGRTGEPAVVEEASPPVRDPGEIFIAANSAYDQGDYDAAISGYSALVARQLASSRIHFNLGNSYLRNGELGRAIAEFRRARNLSPRDEDIEANLDFARGSARDAIAPPEPSPVVSTLFFWYFLLSWSELVRLAAVMSVLFWGLAIVWIWRRESEILRWTMLAAAALLVGTLASLAGHALFSQPVAVVVPQEIDAFTAPDVESVVRFKLHAGTELRIRDEREGWLRISLPDGQQGWIEADWTERVEG